jgi:Skp family chaperone for outer membrane proteins
MPEDHTQQTSESPATSGVKYIPQGAQSEGADPAAQAGASPGAAPVHESTGPTQAQQPDPATIATQTQAQLKQAQQQLNRMRSQLSASDRALRSREEEWASEREHMSQQVQQMQMSDMSDSERVAYERDLYRNRAEEAQQHVSNMSYQLEYADAMQQWRGYYQQMGIPMSELDNSSIENMQHSALRYSNARMRHMQEQQQQQLQPAPQSVQPQQNRVQPPQVTTSVPQGATPGQARWNDIPYEEWDAIYKKAERGQIGSDQLPQ